MSIIDMNIAQEGFNANGCKKGRSKTTKRIWCNTKRSSKAKALHQIEKDMSND